VTQAAYAAILRLAPNPICDPTGEVIGVSVFASDITERRQAEEVLRESEKEFRAMADTTLWPYT